ncbi:MAG: peptide chain release factor N(5)-glutamine methyltransferase [Chloroflexi bacterium]|nr:peptide chain release factor N(5)-glutamine methyltransferase [Chloroflexota bacterium]
MTVSQARCVVSSTLSSYGVAEPLMEADLLLCYVLGTTRLSLHLEPDRSLTEGQYRTLTAFVERRSVREPLAYILGECEFYGMSFHVDQRVLIPRPETETLVEKAVEVARALAVRQGHPPVIADVGTGSGCIAIALAVQCPESRVFAADVSMDALEVAGVNCRKHGVEARVEIVHGDLLQALPCAVDIMVANLPYIQRGEISHLAPEVSRFEPFLALDGGDSGLEHVSRLLAQSASWLRPRGTMLLEVGCGQAPGVMSLAAESLPGCHVSSCLDLGGIERVVVVEPLAPFCQVTENNDRASRPA